MLSFTEDYKKLNKAQKDAVDTIEGPVMVVAGPGTGKTQVLALRIANILQKTDSKADSILCLTFTNSGVKAMRERLRQYMGTEASKVKISTFHSFGMDLIEQYYRVLDMDSMPKLLDEKDSILLCDRILENNSWEYLRPRGDNSRYFKDLKSLISGLKRERITSLKLISEIKNEISSLENDPESISSRGARKGEMKREVEQKIAGLNRTLEAVKFYELYEKEKEEGGFLDYDDVLEKVIQIIEESETAKYEIKENYLYILVDEHQDSSGIQNEFLKAVWGGDEKPNIFVVGDDRQLIYGFGGASLEYFEEFKHIFGKAKLITLVENYRSTQKILDTSHSLLKSSIVSAQLKSNHTENHNLVLVEVEYQRDEIIAFGLEVKELITRKKDGLDPNHVALLVPKNKQVRSAISILRDLGLPVSSGENLNFFDSRDAQSFIRVLKILSNPTDGVYFGESLFDPIAGIDPIKAHKFLKMRNMREFSLLDVLQDKNSNTLFKDKDDVSLWVEKLQNWLSVSNTMPLYSFVQKIGSELLLDTSKKHEDLIERVEVVRTMLHLFLSQIEKNTKLTLADFIVFLTRIEEYGQDIPLAIFAKDEGIKVMTLHSSKGLEFDYVWIAHMDENSFTSSMHGGFTLPDSVKDIINKTDDEVHKRQLYVAITRAKRFCTISYATTSYTGGDLYLSDIVSSLDEHFDKKSAKDTENKILAHDPKSYISSKKQDDKNFEQKDLVKLVAKEYEDKKVSVSLLNNFFECPWKWYFRNLLQLPEEKSESLEFGNIVHGAIDYILKNGELPEEKHYANLKKDDRNKAEGIVEEWYKNRYKELSKNRKNEESVSLSDERFPYLNIYGKIDLIEILPARPHDDSGAGGGEKKVRVTDFKTGSRRKASDIEKRDSEGRMSDYMRQLAMYSYLLTKNHKWNKDVEESVLEFLEAKKDGDKFYRTHITDEEIELLVKDIADYDQLLKTGEWLNRPCNFKSYGKANAVCEYCKLAEIYK